VKPILPGSCLGILGGGQLARMTGFAAQAMGYRVHIYDPGPECPARDVAHRTTSAPWNDPAALAEFAAGCDVITLDIENIPVAGLHQCADFAPLRPGPRVLEVVQNKARQKAWLAQNGFPIGPCCEATDLPQLGELLAAYGTSFVKSAFGGYDGRGQVLTNSYKDAATVWRTLGNRPCVVEQALDLDCEISVLVARRPSGQHVVYPPAMNHHQNQILQWSVLPGEVSGRLRADAQALASSIAQALDVEGLLVVEMFVTNAGQLLVNELAPRPHNSYHASERACATSQFEQLVRAVCDLPLGDAQLIAPTAIVNILGDLWDDIGAPDFSAALRDPRVRLHLYGKTSVRRGRKMGHLSCVAPDPNRAVEGAMQAYGGLRSVTSHASCQRQPVLPKRRT
jgi:5-(carboxyamino)imidazole ribonucleotide synthase